jgi:hypothetical protein
MRLIVTGSRTWDRPDAVWGALDILAHELAAAGETELVVVHGACFPTKRGPDGKFPLESADYLADLWCRRDGHPLKVRAERHPAKWRQYRKRAGYLRNKAMVDLGADLVLAFLRDDSAGTTGCIELAEAAGLTPHVLDYADLPPADSLPERAS